MTCMTRKLIYLLQLMIIIYGYCSYWGASERLLMALLRVLVRPFFGFSGILFGAGLALIPLLARIENDSSILSLLILGRAPFLDPFELSIDSRRVFDLRYNDVEMSVFFINRSFVGFVGSTLSYGALPTIEFLSTWCFWRI